MTTVAKLNPYRSFKEWSNFVIGGVTIPGVVLSVDGVRKPENWIVQMGIQASYAITLWRGTKLAESMTIVTNLFDETSFDAWYDVVSTLRPKLGKKPPSLSIVNAAVNFVKVTRVSCIYVDPPKWSPQAATWTGELAVIEFRPQIVAPIGPADPPKAKTENDLLADELVRSINQSKKL